MVHGRRVVVVAVIHGRLVVVVRVVVVYFVVAGKFQIFVLGFEEGVGLDGPFIVWSFFVLFIVGGREDWD